MLAFERVNLAHLAPSLRFPISDGDESAPGSDILQFLGDELATHPDASPMRDVPELPPVLIQMGEMRSC